VSCELEAQVRWALGQVRSVAGVTMRADPNYYTVLPVSPMVPANSPLSGTLIRGIPFVAGEPRRDEVRRAVLDTFGPIPADGLVVYSPFAFPHGTDDETDLEGAVIMPAADAMIVRADVYRQLGALEEGIGSPARRSGPTTMDASVCGSGSSGPEAPTTVR
jgi:hypothetical protein